MKCSKCSYSNRTKAHYCYKCGNPFTKKEREEALKHTFTYYLEEAENVKEVVTLSKITDSKIFRFLVLFSLICIGFFQWYQYGNKFKILNSNDYKIQYNEKKEEYYLIVQKEETTLNLYVPNQVEKIMISHYDYKGNLLEKQKNNLEEVILKENNYGDYYILSSYSEEKQDDLKIYIIGDQYE